MEPLKKKKRNLWVLHLGYEGENKSKRKEKGKYWIGNTCTWTRFIGTVATQISLFRNSKLVRTTYFYSYVHLESCHLLLARYFVKYPGGVYSDNSNNWKSFLSSKFRTWTGSNCASIHFKNIIPLKLRTPHLLFIRSSVMQDDARRRGGEERSDKNRARHFAKIYGLARAGEGEGYATRRIPETKSYRSWRMRGNSAVIGRLPDNNPSRREGGVLYGTSRESSALVMQRRIE